MVSSQAVTDGRATSARYLKLPLSFDATRLLAELDALLTPQWIDHFNTRDYDGGWRCLALRAADGQPRHITALSEANFLDTPALAQCPYFRAVLDTFACDKASVRLMALDAGAVIKPHRDVATAFEDGLARLHVPLQTDPSVTFCIDGEEIHFSRGDTWYLNAGRTHAVHNRGARSRIHLVLDCRVNPWLRRLFAQAGMVERAPGGADLDGNHPLAHQRRALLRAADFAPPPVAAPEVAPARAGPPAARLAGSSRAAELAGSAQAAAPAGPVESAVTTAENLMTTPAETLHGWFPVAVSDAPPGLWWRHLGTRPFTEPFFTDTLQRQPPAERLRRFTDWRAFDDLPEALAPTAFIFHVSRCGSTLLTQLLATLPACVALSEPPVLDDFLRLRHAAAPSDSIARLRALVRALGQRRDPRQRHLVIKLDSWHLRDLALFRAAFADTPMLFLYREPLQVLASHQRQRGPQMLPGLIDPAWLGVTFHDGEAAGDADAARLAPADLDRYCLHVLRALMAAALAAPRGEGRELILLNYRDVAALADGPLLARLGIDCGPAERDAMRLRATFHAKHGAPFLGDPVPADRRGAAPEPALLDQLARLYAALEQSHHNNNIE